MSDTEAPCTDTLSEGFLNSSCTSSVGSSGSGGSSASQAPARSPLGVGTTSPHGAAEKVSLATLPDGVLERIYSFCPCSVVAHLAVCSRFNQQLVYADAVWLRPKVAASRPFLVSYAGGRSHPVVEPNQGAPNWSLSTAEVPQLAWGPGANLPPLIQPHWSAPPADTYTAPYHHKDYPGDHSSRVSTGDLAAHSRPTADTNIILSCSSLLQRAPKPEVLKPKPETHRRPTSVPLPAFHASDARVRLPPPVALSSPARSPPPRPLPAPLALPPGSLSRRR